MNVEEIKKAAAKLSPYDRFALAVWIEGSEDVRALRREEMIRELEMGIAQADRGELLEADDVFMRVREGLQPS